MTAQQTERAITNNAAAIAHAYAMFEDAEWMLDAGESFEGILRRLDTTWDAFSRRMVRHDQTKLRRRMVERRTFTPEKIGV
jgi:UDP-N-acetylmuramate-alanine ligase